jgi:hypothetical protein
MEEKGGYTQHLNRSTIPPMAGSQSLRQWELKTHYEKLEKQTKASFPIIK